ncbi:hypothetical protein BsWGS_17037 [Bradybaena similaris]
MFDNVPTFTSIPVRKCTSLRLDWATGDVFRPVAEEKADSQDGAERFLGSGRQDNRLLPAWLQEARSDGGQVNADSNMVASVDDSPPRLNVCPEFPTNLRGELTCLCDPVTPESIQASWPHLEPGGRLRPLSCRPRERLAIIIPFSNRLPHLHTLIRNLLPILDAQRVDATFFVIEQLAPAMFNRAALHNIGFLESQRMGAFDCYIFHDVDLVPMDDRILYRCGDHPRHFAVSIKRHGRRAAKKMYNEYFGGVVGLTSSQYTDVNGNSNLYFGWGGEDDDLLLRILTKGYNRVQEKPDIYRYQMLHHDRNDQNRGNVDRMLLLQTAVDRQDYEGLSTTKYTVKEIRHQQLYVWVSVSLNMTELLLTAPDYTLSAIRSLLEISKTVT